MIDIEKIKDLFALLLPLLEGIYLWSIAINILTPMLFLLSYYFYSSLEDV